MAGVIASLVGVWLFGFVYNLILLGWQSYYNPWGIKDGEVFWLALRWPLYFRELWKLSRRRATMRRERLQNALDRLNE